MTQFKRSKADVLNQDLQMTDGILAWTDQNNGFFVLPNYDTASLPDAGPGVLVYNTTTNKLNFHNGTSWEEVTSS